MENIPDATIKGYSPAMETNTILYLSSPPDFSLPETLYLKLRRKEGRILSDEAVKNLPKAPANSTQVKEWRWRARTWLRFQHYLPVATPLRILDLGCGNGWMAHRMAQNPLCDVWAMDLNQEELEQGARLFGRKNLQFVYGDLRHEALFAELGSFDIITLAASVQYFPNLSEIIGQLRRSLTPNGEIHLLDSPVYPNVSARNAARQRSRDYYTSMEVPEMANYYHHHLWPEAEALGAKNLNGTWNIRLLQWTKWLAPFPWLRFTKEI